ncbi:MAG: DUF2075 domain-containing protein [Thaumarchaeota archaeon]|nr:DUF2075 domain-containing protein [Nitrososphaerota archaeon]
MVDNGVVKSGVPGLDALLGGGFVKGNVVLVLGEPGTGKTILSSQFLHNGAMEGDKSVFVGMNEPESRFVSEMLKVGMDFDSLEKGGKFAYVDATDLRRIPERALVGRIPVGGKELGLVNLIDVIQTSAEKHSPTRMVVDSISDLIFRFPKVEERRPVVLDLVDSLQATGATCILTSELLSTGEHRELQPEEYLAEGVVLLRTLPKGGRSIQILKMRGAAVDAKPRPYLIRDRGVEVLATEEIY